MTEWLNWTELKAPDQAGGGIGIGVGGKSAFCFPAAIRDKDFVFLEKQGSREMGYFVFLSSQTWRYENKMRVSMKRWEKWVGYQRCTVEKQGDFGSPALSPGCVATSPSSFPELLKLFFLPHWGRDGDSWESLTLSFRNLCPWYGKFQESCYSGE